jgi:hypothetical protein
MLNWAANAAAAMLTIMVPPFKQQVRAVPRHAYRSLDRNYRCIHRFIDHALNVG